MLALRARAGDSPAAPFCYLSPSVLRLLALSPQACRWPSGDLNLETLDFCAAPRLGRGSYCASHRKLACEAVR